MFVVTKIGVNPPRTHRFSGFRTAMFRIIRAAWRCTPGTDSCISMASRQTSAAPALNVADALLGDLRQTMVRRAKHWRSTTRHPPTLCQFRWQDCDSSHIPTLSFSHRSGFKSIGEVDVLQVCLTSCTTAGSAMSTVAADRMRSTPPDLTISSLLASFPANLHKEAPGVSSRVHSDTCSQ